MKQNCVTTTLDLLADQGGRFIAVGSRRSPLMHVWQLVASAVPALTTSVWAMKRWVRNILS